MKVEEKISSTTLNGIRKEKSKEELQSFGSNQHERKTIFVDQSIEKQLINAETETVANRMSI